MYFYQLFQVLDNVIGEVLLDVELDWRAVAVGEDWALLTDWLILRRKL